MKFLYCLFSKHNYKLLHTTIEEDNGFDRLTQKHLFKCEKCGKVKKEIFKI